MINEEPSAKAIGVGVSAVLATATFIVCLGMYGCPRYAVYQQELEGEAELKKANYSKQVQVQDAVGKFESAKSLAQAEVERAKGVAQANQIIGSSLKNNEEYLRYLWIHNLAQAEEKGAQIIYVPTEANLPLLEAGKRR